MNTPFSRVRLWSMLFLASVTGASAHPGHDGHELTWDFEHLAAHPLATALCGAAFLAVVWGAGLLAARSSVRRQSLRGSAPSAGK